MDSVRLNTLGLKTTEMAEILNNSDCEYFVGFYTNLFDAYQVLLNKI